MPTDGLSIYRRRLSRESRQSACACPRGAFRAVTSSAAKHGAEVHGNDVEYHSSSPRWWCRGGGWASWAVPHSPPHLGLVVGPVPPGETLSSFFRHSADPATPCVEPSAPGATRLVDRGHGFRSGLLSVALHAAAAAGVACTHGPFSVADGWSEGLSLEVRWTCSCSVLLE